MLDVIQYALSAGEGARLIRALVYDTTSAADWPSTSPGASTLGSSSSPELNPKVTRAEALATIDRELARLAQRGLTELELERAKGQLRAQVLREIASNNGRAHAMGNSELLVGGWRAALELPERYAAGRQRSRQAGGARDVQSVAPLGGDARSEAGFELGAARQP